MGASGLGSRAIIGSFFNELQQNLGASWIPGCSMEFLCNQESETYKWLGMSPAMREWIGGRHAYGLREQGVTIINKKFEATMEVLVDEIRRDKTTQVMLRVAELARRTNAHWASLLTTLIVAGTSTACYDSSYFFYTAHSEGDSGSQNNDLTGAAATNTQPTSAEMEAAIMACIQAILGFKDDQGEPMNEDAKEFMIMVPAVYLAPAVAATKNEFTSAGVSNTLVNMKGFGINLVVNPRLSSGAIFYAFRTDAKTKALIRQSEEDVTIAAVAEGSELEFNEDKHHYGVKAIRNVGYGYWQHACVYTFT